MTDRIIEEVVWVVNATLLIKELNRAGITLCNTSTVGIHGTTIRQLSKEGEQNDDGSIDYLQNIRRLPEAFGPDEGAYLDIVPSKEGYNHLS